MVYSLFLLDSFTYKYTSKGVFFIFFSWLDNLFMFSAE